MKKLLVLIGFLALTSCALEYDDCMFRQISEIVSSPYVITNIILSGLGSAYIEFKYAYQSEIHNANIGYDDCEKVIEHKNSRLENKYRFCYNGNKEWNACMEWEKLMRNYIIAKLSIETSDDYHIRVPV